MGIWKNLCVFWVIKFVTLIVKGDKKEFSSELWFRVWSKTSWFVGKRMRSVSELERKKVWYIEGPIYLKLCTMRRLEKSKRNKTSRINHWAEVEGCTNYIFIFIFYEFWYDCEVWTRNLSSTCMKIEFWFGWETVRYETFRILHGVKLFKLRLMS